MEQTLDHIHLVTEEELSSHYSPVHPKYFFRLASTFLLVSFLIFCAFIV